jgi:hypothetical protein
MSGVARRDDTPAECNSAEGAATAAVAATADALGYKQSSSLYTQQLQAEVSQTRLAPATSCTCHESFLQLTCSHAAWV